MSATKPKVPPVAEPADRPRTVHRLHAPSVRTVGELLLRGRMTAMQIRHAAGLPRRTVYSALATLRKEGLVEQRRSLQDSRQSYFWLAAASMPPASNLQPDAIAAGEATDEPATSVL